MYIILYNTICNIIILLLYYLPLTCISPCGCCISVAVEFTLILVVIYCIISISVILVWSGRLLAV